MLYQVLKDVKFIISFDGIVLKDLVDCPGFTEQDHVDGIGGWAGAIKAKSARIDQRPDPALLS